MFLDKKGSVCAAGFGDHFSAALALVRKILLVMQAIKILFCYWVRKIVLVLLSNNESCSAAG